MSDFIKLLVGEEARDILEKASETNAILKQNLMSYLCLSWVNRIVDWNGEIPGVGGTLVISKSEHCCNGLIELNGKAHYFNEMNKTEVAALLNLYLTGQNPDFRFDLDKGKTYNNIDQLVKFQIEASSIKKSSPNGFGLPQAPEKQEPIPPIATQPTPKRAKAQMTIGKDKKETVKKNETNIKINKSEMAASCPECGERFFDGTKFTGCFCIRDMAKSQKTSLTPLNGPWYSLNLDGWGEEEALLILSSLKGK